MRRTICSLVEDLSTASVRCTGLNRPWTVEKRSLILTRHVPFVLTQTRAVLSGAIASLQIQNNQELSSHRFIALSAVDFRRVVLHQLYRFTAIWVFSYFFEFRRLPESASRFIPRKHQTLFQRAER